MGKYITKNMQQIAVECEELLQQFSLDVQDCEHKLFKTALHVHERYIHVKIKTKVVGRKQCFGKFSLKISDAFELEYLRRFLRDFAFSSRHHNVFNSDCSSTEAYGSE